LTWKDVCFRTIERQYVKFGGASVFLLTVERVASWDYEKLPTEEWILPTKAPSEGWGNRPKAWPVGP
jgi:hypothetical protein